MDAPPEPLTRLLAAIERRDLDGITGCFAEDYSNVTPAHPARGFTGRAQVRRNWEQILAAVPDLEARVPRWVQEADVLWTEWTQSGTRRDGASFEMCGIVLFELAGTGDRRGAVLPRAGRPWRRRDRRRRAPPGRE